MDPCEQYKNRNGTSIANHSSAANQLPSHLHLQSSSQTDSLFTIMAFIKSILVAALAFACLCGSAQAGKCMFVDGDCKPNPAALPPGAKGAASSWRTLLEGFQACASKAGGACSGTCTTMPGKGCTLTLAARKAALGPLAATFGACPATPAAQCASNTNCKAGAGGTCVIAATGIINTFSLTSTYPAAIGTLTSCKALVANPAACNAA